jgi:hypothetical protein
MQTAEPSANRLARITGGLYLFTVITAVVGEVFFHNTFSIAIGVVAVAGYVAVTLLIYRIFKPVNPTIALGATLINLISLGFEAAIYHPHHFNVGMILHAAYCLLLGYLIFKSNLLPRALGLLMTAAGAAWLTNLSPPLAKQLQPTISAIGILAEAIPMLWLLFVGLKQQQNPDAPSFAEQR